MVQEATINFTCLRKRFVLKRKFFCFGAYLIIALVVNIIYLGRFLSTPTLKELQWAITLSDVTETKLSISFPIILNKTDNTSFYGDQASFEQNCGFWIELADEWYRTLNDKGPIRVNGLSHFRTEDIISGVLLKNGIGDRTAAMLSIFGWATDFGVPLVIFWPELPMTFEPSIYLSKYSLYKREYPLEYAHIGHGSDSCRRGTHLECNLENHINDNCPVFLRTCFSEKICSKLVDYHKSFETYPDIPVSEVVGCPLRMMLEPKKEMMEFEINWFMDSKNIMSTLETALNTLKSYRTISIHLRFGDNVLISGDETAGVVQRREKIVHRLISCLGIIEAEMELKGEKKDMPLKWVIASDDHSIKEYFRVNYPSKSVFIESKPIHVQKLVNMNESNRVTIWKELLAEWFFIGGSDEIVGNLKGNYGLSGFSRQAWLYHLKDTFYLINPSVNETCKKETISYLGNLLHVDKLCRTNKTT